MDKDKAEIRHAGQERNTFSGDSYKCARIDANNRALEAQQRQYERHQRDLEAYGLKR